ncbi:MAG TPA: hypothetical protein VJ777_04765 [Mycobacterium sp.]|nr:hypothetical protein [Mycobacterium sp.]
MPVPENAQTGWEIYKASDYESTLPEINDELQARSLAPVSQRMYSHYRKLHRYGYEQYIAINQLDVRTMEDPVWDRALRGRYPLNRVEESVRVLLLANDEPVELLGVAEEVSDGEVILRISGSRAMDVFGRAGAALWTLEVIFTSTGELRLCDVLKVTLDHRRRRVTVRATFIGVPASEELIARELLSTRTFRIVVGSEVAVPLLARAAQQLFWMFSGTEAVRIAAAEMLQSLDLERRYGVQANRVERLSVASPLEALIMASGPVLIGVGILIERIVGARKSWWEGTKARHEATAAEEDVTRLRWERARRDVLDGIGVEEVAAAIADAVRRELGLPGRELRVSEDDPALKTLLTHALPALGELVEAGDGDITFEAIGGGREDDGPP